MTEMISDECSRLEVFDFEGMIQFERLLVKKEKLEDKKGFLSGGK